MIVSLVATSDFPGSFIRGRTMARLLAFLVSTPGEEFHTRELVRRIGGTEHPVQRALEILERDGIACSRRVGNLRLWRIDPGQPLYASLRALFSSTHGVAAELAAALRRDPGIEFAFLFGSYAEGAGDAESDIDLFILGAPDWPRLARVTNGIEGRLGRELSPVAWDADRVRRALRQGSPFFDSVRREPKVWIVGRDDAFERRLSELAHARALHGPSRLGRRRRGSNRV